MTLDQQTAGEPRGTRSRGRDLDDADEVATMVRRFYADVAQDDLLGPMFVEVARVDWAAHLPKLTAFWCRILLGQPGYEGNPYRAHLLVHARRRFTPTHFERWLELFEDTLDDGWSGPKVEQARSFAHRVALAHAKQLAREPLAGSNAAPGAVRTAGEAVPVELRSVP